LRVRIVFFGSVMTVVVVGDTELVGDRPLLVGERGGARRDGG
jgi:hypothetical protein